MKRNKLIALALSAATVLNSCSAQPVPAQEADTESIMAAETVPALSDAGISAGCVFFSDLPGVGAETALRFSLTWNKRPSLPTSSLSIWLSASPRPTLLFDVEL